MKASRPTTKAAVWGRRLALGGVSAIVLFFLVIALLAAVVRWQSVLYENDQAVRDPSRAEYADTQWDVLVPKGWDPVQPLRDKIQGDLPDSGAEAKDLEKKMRKTWDNAPTNSALDGVKVRLAGYVVPLQADRNTLQEFLLVPYFGACIHVPPPPANQIVHVSLGAPIENVRTMEFVTVSGTLHTDRRNSSMGKSGYIMDAVRMEKGTARVW